MTLRTLAGGVTLLFALTACNDSDQRAPVTPARAEMVSAAAMPPGAPDPRCSPSAPTVLEVAVGTEGDSNRDGKVCTGRQGPAGAERAITLDNLHP